MERFIVKYCNGKIRQQKGINATYQYLIGIGVIAYVIDTKTGEIMYGDKDEALHTEKISIYEDSDMIVPKI